MNDQRTSAPVWHIYLFVHILKDFTVHTKSEQVTELALEKNEYESILFDTLQADCSVCNSGKEGIEEDQQ